MTIYKKVPGFDNYMAGENGEIYSLKSGKFLKKIKHHRGYYMYTLYAKNNGSRRMWGHRIVMLAFKGASNLQVNHIDGDGFNNQLINLEYCTPKENMQHSFKVLGRKAVCGEKQWKSKLKNESVVDIYTSKNCPKFLAAKYGVSVATISLIRNGATWKHITSKLFL